MAEVEVSEFHDPVKIKNEHAQEVVNIQAKVDELSKYRQEIGRLHQVLNNMVQMANEAEVDLAKMRRDLAQLYNLEKSSTGQWAIDFEKREFVKVSSNGPVIP